MKDEKLLKISKQNYFKLGNGKKRDMLPSDKDFGSSDKVGTEYSAYLLNKDGFIFNFLKQYLIFLRF